MKSAVLTLALLGTLSSVAYAHIDLVSPTPRYPEEVAGANKACPCGVGESNRLCNVDGDRSDPDRAASNRVTTFTANETIIFRFEEYVGHSGRFRVAIDFDGADLEDFNQNVLVDIPDPPGGMGNIGQGAFWEIEVPLPNVNCESCTLQLIQMMDGNTDDPVLDPVNRSTYYTCADIRIEGADGTPTADAGAFALDAGDLGEPEVKPTSGGCQTGSGTSAWGFFGLLAACIWIGRRRNFADVS